MAQMPNLRPIVNGTPIDATDPQYNFQTIESHLATEVINRDGTVAMDAPLTLNVPGSADNHAATVGQLNNAIPPGAVVPFAGASGQTPTGWLLCNGSSYDPVANPNLFAVIGTTYGGDAAAPLLPDMRGLMPLGVGPSDALASTGGRRDAVLLTHTHVQDPHDHSLSSHTHNVNPPNTATTNDSHTHTAVSPGAGTDIVFRSDSPSGLFLVDGNAANKADQVVIGGAKATDQDTHNHDVNIGTFTSLGPNNNTSGSRAAVNQNAGDEADPTDLNLPPYLALNFIIRGG